jgi:hypothetical protein
MVLLVLLTALRLSDAPSKQPLNSFRQINSNLGELTKHHVALQRQTDVLEGTVKKVHDELTALQQPGTVLHSARSNTLRFFNVPKVGAAARGAGGKGTGGSSSAAASSSSRVPLWQEAVYGAKEVEDAVRGLLESSFPGLPLPAKLFSNAVSWPYGRKAAESPKEFLQMLVVTLTDSSLRGALFAVAKQLKQTKGYTFTVEWTLAEKQARQQIEASPAFQRALKQANAEGKKANWDFGTCTFGRRTADSKVWSVASIAELGEEARQQQVA